MQIMLGVISSHVLEQMSDEKVIDNRKHSSSHSRSRTQEMVNLTRSCLIKVHGYLLVGWFILFAS